MICIIKEYNIAASVLKHVGPIDINTVRAEQEAPAAEEPAAGYKPGDAILFATQTCPNCRIACSYLDKAGFRYEKLYADENAELAKHFAVKQAPTLVLFTENGFEKYAGAGAIKQMLSQTA